MADEAAPPVRARGLVKRYKEVLAVDHIDLNVRAGDVYGFLGPNGAGKTTTLRMALGLIMPTEGTVELFGRDPMREGARALRGRRGVRRGAALLPLPERRARTSNCSPRSTATAPRERIDEVLEIVELSPRAEHRVGGYSHGMRQRLGIAAALLRRPRLLILDEPATGLDPGRDARHARADPPSRRRGDHGPALEPPAARGAGTVRPRGDRRLRPRRLRGRARRPAPPGRGRLPAAHDRRRARARDRCARSPASSTPRAGEHGLSFQAEERDVGALSLALGRPGIGILALTPELATLEDLFFRLTEGERRDGCRIRQRAPATPRSRWRTAADGRADGAPRRREPRSSSAAVAAPAAPPARAGARGARRR